MFAYFTVSMMFKTSVQLQRYKNVSKTFETHGPPRGRSVGASGEFKQRENKGI